MNIVRNNIDSKTWDMFVLAHGPRSGRFLQSWSWGEFVKKTEGSKGSEGAEGVDRVAWMSEANELLAVAQEIRKSIQYFGTYAYIPRGPIEKKSNADFFADIANVAIATDVFVRAEFPNAEQAPACRQARQDLSLQIKKTNPIQPAHTLITDLSISNDQLLVNMHEKTRYNIRLAQKKEVKIEIGTASIDEVWPVFEATSLRDAFRLHEKEYYRKMIEYGVAFLAVAKHEDDILATNIMIDFGDTRTYLHGASSNVKRNFMAPYLLHFELMKDAKAKGIKFYDWWGVAPLDSESNHAWAGISRFKRGFGGEEVSYPDAVDVVLNPWRYRFYQIARNMNHWLQKL